MLPTKHISAPLASLLHPLALNDSLLAPACRNQSFHYQLSFGSELHPTLKAWKWSLLAQNKSPFQYLTL